MSSFQEIQKLFIDKVDNKSYVKLDSSILFYKKLEESIEKPLKMILLYGRPGTGKSMLLNKLFFDQREKDVFLLETPIVDESEFIATLYSFLYPETSVPDNLSYNRFIDICKSLKESRHICVLLDEAQLYSSTMMEKIRLISDTRTVKFVVALHKTDQEEVIAKEHFQSRIWETIEIANGSVHDTQMYIQKKLIQKNFFEITNWFQQRNIKLIHRLTQGNYREINKLLYTLFEIYAVYEEIRPSKIIQGEIKQKHIEMAALKLGFLHA